MTTVRTIMTEVEVDLDDFDDDDIREEFESRNLASAGSDISDQIDELYYALYFGLNDKAMEIARKLAMDATGRVLP